MVKTKKKKKKKLKNNKQTKGGLCWCLQTDHFPQYCCDEWADLENKNEVLFLNFQEQVFFFVCFFE